MISLAISAVLLGTSPSPRATVDAMFAAFNRHDPEAMHRLYADDARLSSSDFCAVRGKRDVRRTYAELFARMPDLHDAVETIVSEGDYVAVRFVASSKKAGFDLPMVTFIRVRGGLIVEDDTRFAVGREPCSP